MHNQVCKSCGGDVRREGNYYVCNFCGSRWTIDADSDVHVIDRANAWGALRDYDFERAVELFEYIIAKEPKNHEAYWGRALADSGIVYVTDLNESKKVPTCNNIRETSFIDSKDVKKAISLAPADIAASYKEQAERIESIRTEWLKKASKEPPYDVFICFKDSDREHNVERTEDSYDAQELYYALTSKGYKVFFSRVSLRNKIAEHYEPYIYNALKTAKVMIVFGEKPEYFRAVWVKNEWNRFRASIERGEKDKNSLVVAYKGMDPADLPAGLRSRQCLNAADITFLDDLKSHIDKILKSQAGKPQGAPKPQPEPVAAPPVKKKKKKGAIIAIAIVLALCIGLGVLINNLDKIGVNINPPEITLPQGSGGGVIIFPIETGKPSGGDNKPGYTVPDFEIEWPTEENPDVGGNENPGEGGDNNGNGTPDDEKADNNQNGIPDYLEGDMNGNGIPDYKEEEFNPDIEIPDGGGSSGEYSEGLDYSLSSDGESYIVVGKGSFTGDILIIPDKYEGKPVTAIEADAFYGCTNLETVKVPDSVKSIGECAFYGCSNIVNLHIPFVGATPDGTENRHFGYIFGAYSYNSQIDLIPQELNSVTVTGDYDIPDYAFFDCNGVRRIYLTGIFMRIGTEAFYDCSDLVSVSIHEESGRIVGDRAFAGTKIELTEYNNARYLSNNKGNSHYMLVEVIDKNVRTFEIHEDTRAIADGAFSGCRRLQSIDIPESVSSIGSSAFEECSVLQTVRLGSRVFEIRDRTFYNCVALSEIELYESLELIGKEAFYNCAALTEIEVPESVQTIGSFAFYGCTALESITLPFIGEARENTNNTHFSYIFSGADTWNAGGFPTNLKTVKITDTYTIPDYAFHYNCSNIESITLPRIFVYIGDYAFSGCTALKSINIANDVEYIGVEAFSNCESLESISIPKDVKELNSTFLNCKSLKEVTLSEGLETIGDKAFNGCEALSKLTIPSTVTAIGAGAFYSCAFVQLDLPEGLKSIGSFAFECCKNLTSIDIPESIETIGSNILDQCTAMVKITLPRFVQIADFGEMRIAYLFGGSQFDSSYEALKIIVIEGGDAVPADAFSGLFSVEFIQLPDGITSIGERAFNQCNNLKSVHIPASVTEIGSSAFNYCTTLESIEISGTVKSIEDYTFNNCTNLKKIVIPDTVEYLGENAFQSCTSLEELTIPNLEIKSWDGSVASGTLYQLFSNGVPETLKKVTLTAATALKAYAFSGCSSIETVVLPDTLTSIGDYAFNGCTNLKSINIPEGITVIATNLFNGCSSLEAITLPSSVEQISTRAFSDCSSLKSINIPNSVHTIGDRAFLGCTGLESITIPESVRNYGAGMLENCSNLQSITLAHIGAHDQTSEDMGYFGYIFGCASYDYHNGVPQSLKTVIVTHETEIFPHAFNGCKYIESITLPDSVTEIGDYAFAGCESLKSMDIPDAVTKISNSTFSGCTSLESVTMHEGIKTIDQYAFKDCTGLTELVIPNSVDVIGVGALENCMGLKKLTIPYVGLLRDGETNSNFGSLFNVTDYSYQYTNSMPAINTVIVTGGQRIADNAFYHCQQITTLHLPASLEFIGENAFYGMEKLQTINYEGGESSFRKISIADTAKEQIDSVKLIYNVVIDPNAPVNTEAPNASEATEAPDVPEETEAPEETTAETQAPTGEYVPVIPDGYVASEGLTFVSNGDGTCYVSGIGTFTGVNLVIPYYSPDGDLVTAVGQVAFREKSIESVVIPDSVTRIETGAFMQCYSLKNVTMSNRISFMGLNAFFEDTALSMNSYDNAHYIGSEENPYLVLIDAFDAGVMYCEIHPDTKIIHPYAFYGSIIQYIVIPSSVRFIGEHAFDYCDSLKEIVIMNGTTYIGQYAFHQCGSVEKLYIPASVKYIGESAFYGMKLCETMYFGGTEDQWNNDVEKQKWAFGGIDDMERSIVYGNTDPEINLPEEAPMLEFVESEDGKCYIASMNTFNYKHIIIPEMSPAGYVVKGIGTYAFQGRQLESIVIPEGVTYIGDYAFSECTSLKNITLPDSLQNVGTDAFYNCGGGELVCTDDGVAKYLGCDNNPYVLLLEISDKNITSYEINDRTRVIYGSSNAGGAFAYCYSLESITIPQSVRCIGEKAFYGCTALKNVVIEEGLIRIEDSSFQSCGIETVNLPASLSWIGPDAFSNCASLTTVNYAGSVHEWLYSGVAGVWSETGDYVIVCSDGTVNKDGTVVTEPEENETPSTQPDVTPPAQGTYSKNLKYASNGDGTCYVSGIGDCSDTDIVIPSVSPDGYTVTGIGDDAFKNCSSLTSITIPDSVTSIGSFALDYCTSLQYNEYDNAYYVGNNTNPYMVLMKAKNKYIESCDIHDDTRIIYTSAFIECTSLTSITIPDNVTSIGHAAFYKCSNLTSITVPDSLISIGDAALASCTSLQGNEYDNAYYLGNNTNPYMVLVKAKGYDITSCEIHADTKFIHSKAFENCNSLESITIPDSVTSISNSAFSTCLNLTSIMFGENSQLVSIGDCAYANCYNLRSITFGKNSQLTSIGDSAFMVCYNLTSINYGGTKAQWEVISKVDGWDYNTGNYTIYCTDGIIIKE